MFFLLFTIYLNCNFSISLVYNNALFNLSIALLYFESCFSRNYGLPNGSVRLFGYPYNFIYTNPPHYYAHPQRPPQLIIPQ